MPSQGEPPRHPEIGDERSAAPDVESPPGTPRWVKLFAVIAVIVVAGFVILLLTGGHSPARHSFGSDPGETAARVSLSAWVR
jgi:hypothetical protein